MNRRLILAFLLLGIAAGACFDPPEIPIEPQISLKSFTFKPIPGNEFQDSVIVELRFEDGDGDLGLAPADSLPPFNELYFWRLSNGSFLKLGDSDTLPPLNCKNYEAIEVAQDSVVNFYVIRNEYYYNFYLDFYRKVNGKFQKFDFMDYNCTPGFKGRFFYLNTTGKERPLEGVIRSGFPSGFRNIFRNDTLKIRAYIYDRNDPAGYPNQDKQPHKSNVVESREFTLSEFLGPI